MILGIAGDLYAGYVVYQTRVGACFIQCLNTETELKKNESWQVFKPTLRRLAVGLLSFYWASVGNN